MDEESLPLLPPDELPQTDEPKKKKPQVNCLQDVLLELMDERKVEPVDIHKATNIPYSTLHGWYMGKVEAQKADENLLKLAKFFNVSLEYLIFGLGDDSPRFEDFENETPEQG